MVTEVSAPDGRPAGERVAAAVEAFCRRALAGPVLAYALIAEPVDPSVESERLRLRRGYRDAFAAVLRDGIDAGELSPTPPTRWPPRSSERSARRSWARCPGPTATRAPTRRSWPASCSSASTHFQRTAPKGASPHERHPRDTTHEVLNQPPPIQPYNVFDADPALGEALEREGGGWGVDRLRDTGALAGSEEAREHSERCERNEPRLLTHDRYGNRVDEVDLDPSWHWILRQAIEREIHSLPWRSPQPGAHVVRGALMFVWGQVNAGVMCPVSMTYSAIPALRQTPELAEEWEPRLVRPDYAGGALAGMAMTEKQGGSDVRANTTRAEPAGDGDYEITGHKWFCSYPRATCSSRSRRPRPACRAS